MDNKDKATEQARRNYNRNPTGKGGFRDHPEHQSPGGWDKNNTYSYWLQYFKSISIEDFKKYKSNNPNMTMAALGAYARIAKSIDERLDFQEVANRTEGMPTQRQEITGQDGEPLVIITDANKVK